MRGDRKEHTGAGAQRSDRKVLEAWLSHLRSRR